MRRDNSDRLSRRALFRWLAGGAGATVLAGGTVVELVNHGVLPGKQILNALDGACSVPSPRMTFSPVGPTVNGSFFSRARRRVVGYSIGYPPGHQPGDELSLIVMLHGFGDDHRTALKGMTPAQAVALHPRRVPTALVTVDGGNGAWTPHPHDDAAAMVIDELIPLCQRRGLGRSPNQIKMLGISMGGFGALAIAEHIPELVTGVAAISPAIWTTYDQARAANPEAFASLRTFEEWDVITHSDKIAGTPTRVAVGVDDPFYDGVKAFIDASPHVETAVFAPGCHTNPFFIEQEPPSIEFLSVYLVHG